LTTRIRDYQELLESEERLTAFMQHSPILAFMKDDRGRYIYVNPQMESTFGVSLDDIRGKADFDWLPSSVARTVLDNDREVLATGHAVETLESVTAADGSVRRWMVVKFPFAKPDGRTFVGGVAVDVTGLHVTQERLAESERRYRHLVDNSQGLICTHDIEGRLLMINPAALGVLGYTADELVGRNLRDLLPSSMTEEFDRYLVRINARSKDTGLMLVAAKNGREHVWQYHNVKIDEPGQPPYVLGHAQDVTELRDAQEQLRKLTLTDELTGLKNRRGFLAMSAQMLTRPSAAGQEFTVVYVDVDGLKRINDAHGHDAGSEMIVAAADVLTNTFRAADVIGRIGGDEFVVLAAASRSTETLILERLKHHQDAFNARSGRPYALTLSVGMAFAAGGSDAGLEDVVRRADQAMYANKRSRAAAR